MKRLARAIAMLVVIASVARASKVVPPPERLPVEHMQLGNGLHVLLAPDATSSSVAVHVRYEAPLVSERGGQAGYTRALEQQLAAGSLHVTDAAARIEAAGGWATTATTEDYLGLTEQVPAHALPLVLWLEAERMAGVADAIRHDALRRFARERIAPNRAMLVIAGRIDTKRTRQLVEHYFGWIPAREGIGRRVNERALPRKSERTTRAVGELASVVVSFPCEPFDPAIEVIAQLLAGGPTSRLPRALAAAGLAVDVRADIPRQRDGALRILATPADGVDPADVAAVIHRELAALRARPADGDEVAAAGALVLTDFWVAMELLSVRAEQLASWSTIGRRGSLLQRWPELLAGVSAQDVAATTQRWLAGALTEITWAERQ